MVKFICLLVLLPFVCVVHAQDEKVGKTTRYWDCCKPSCSWPGDEKGPRTAPVQTCDKSDAPVDANTVSGCDGGSAYMCTSQQPWAINESVSYGFAAVKLEGETEKDFCCACYELTFTDTAIAGQKMVVQATNTGADLGGNHFDLSMPGGGFGKFNGCTRQFDSEAPNDATWGERYGGVSTVEDCAKLPQKLQAGCQWRFGWFKNANNPAMKYHKVVCPEEITAKTGCKRTDE